MQLFPRLAEKTSAADLWPLWPLENKTSCNRCQSRLTRRSMNNVGQWLNLSPHTHDSLSPATRPAVSPSFPCFWGWATLQITGNSITHYIRQQKPHPTSTNNSSDTRRWPLSASVCFDSTIIYEEQIFSFPAFSFYSLFKYATLSVSFPHTNTIFLILMTSHLL